MDSMSIVTPAKLRARDKDNDRKKVVVVDLLIFRPKPNVTKAVYYETKTRSLVLNSSNLQWMHNFLIDEFWSQIV